mmetsp:Transcript_34524/g.52820  ORF Transcript_34524/g.52820 Transcript_34524/m.52820 type:complete len:115 (+) Transcript_34524:955-1299(+)|eukprot:CAMPEP_0170488752 /NCGR_PEP_ID=MMETSP0208-20121228/7229_1 /TAXON_ID=197538 /ORGANISM="Strombidium inclinatum, Strain S3" /LENGTH=114 /DNA_ID=CAMNT_0010763423 /DNA_START=1735 /DNA_END=2079 /DNA_ORIENTATION=-
MEKVPSKKYSRIEAANAHTFFSELHKAGLKKKASVHQNLIEMLKEKENPQHLAVKKVKHALLDFGNVPYFQSVGLRKRKLPQVEEEYDEEYYDEEEDDQVRSDLPPKKQSPPVS